MTTIEWGRICCPVDFSEPSHRAMCAAADLCRLGSALILLHADVLGTHVRVDREHMITGSVAEGVVRKAQCPVLTIRAE